MVWQKGLSGNPAGRQRGHRVKLTEAFLRDLAKDWQQHGLEAIEAARMKDPAGYLRIMASLLPRDHKHLHDAGGSFAAMLERVNRVASKDVTPKPPGHRGPEAIQLSRSQ